MSLGAFIFSVYIVGWGISIVYAVRVIRKLRETKPLFKHPTDYEEYFMRLDWWDIVKGEINPDDHYFSVPVTYGDTRVIDDSRIPYIVGKHSLYNRVRFDKTNDVLHLYEGFTIPFYIMSERYFNEGEALGEFNHPGVYYVVKPDKDIMAVVKFTRVMHGDMLVEYPLNSIVDERLTGHAVDSGLYMEGNSVPVYKRRFINMIKSKNPYSYYLNPHGKKPYTVRPMR